MKLKLLYIITYLTVYASHGYAQDAPITDQLYTSLKKSSSYPHGAFYYQYKIKLPGENDTLSFNGTCVYSNAKRNNYPMFNIQLDKQLSYIFDGTYLYAIDLRNNECVIFNTNQPSIGLDPIVGNMFSRILENPYMSTDMVDRLMSFNFHSTFEEFKECEGRKLMNYKVRRRGGNTIYRICIDTVSKLPIKITLLIDSGKSDNQYEEFLFSNFDPEQGSNRFNFSASQLRTDLKITEFVRRRKELLTVGKQTPGLDEISSNGDSISLQISNNKIYLLDFTYNTCYPCIKSIPALKRIKSKFENYLQIISINPIDGPKISDFINHHGITYPVINDNGKITEKFKIRSFPTFVLIDNNLIIRSVIEGYDESFEKEISEKINSLINDKN